MNDNSKGDKAVKGVEALMDMIPIHGDVMAILGGRHEESGDVIVIEMAPHDYEFKFYHIIPVDELEGFIENLRGCAEAPVAMTEEIEKAEEETQH